MWLQPILNLEHHGDKRSWVAWSAFLEVSYIEKKIDSIEKATPNEILSFIHFWKVYEFFVDLATVI